MKEADYQELKTCALLSTAASILPGHQYRYIARVGDLKAALEEPASQQVIPACLSRSIVGFNLLGIAKIAGCVTGVDAYDPKHWCIVVADPQSLMCYPVSFKTREVAEECLKSKDMLRLSPVVAIQDLLNPALSVEVDL